MISPVDIELATYVSWPAFEQQDYRGWILRFADGHTKRANSVNAIVPINADLRSAVDHCETFYRARFQPVIFRLLSFTEDSGLDTELVARGYSFIDPSLVLYLDLGSAGSETADPLSVERSSWLKIFCDVSGQTRPNKQLTPKSSRKFLAQPFLQR